MTRVSNLASGKRSVFSLRLHTSYHLKFSREYTTRKLLLFSTDEQPLSKPNPVEDLMLLDFFFDERKYTCST